MEGAGRRLTMRRLRDVWIGRKSGTLIWGEACLLATFGFLRDILGAPAMITYLFDVINVFLFVAILVRKKYDNDGRYYRSAFALVLVFLFLTLLRALTVGGSAVLYLWGLRNTFRFYVFFTCCVALWGARDVLRISDFFKVLFFLNVPLCMLEYAMGYSGDYVGGSFGVQQGGNGYLNILLVITTTIYVTEYLAGRTSILKLSLVLALSFYMMAVAELKVYFLELMIVVFVATLSESLTVRSLTLALVMLAGIIVGLYIMQFFFSGSGIDFFTSDALATYMGDAGYTGTGDLSRMNALSRITSMFFSGDPMRFLFGFGLGNCSYSSNFAMLTSSFYHYFSWLHYAWFSDAYVYLETGLVGLVCFEAFFVLVLVVSRLRRYRDSGLRTAVNCTSVIALMAILLSVYNSSLTVESGYLVYMFLAVPFILDKYRKTGDATHGSSV